MERLQPQQVLQVPAATALAGNATSFYEPVTNAISSLLLLGTYAVQIILGRPGGLAGRPSSVDAFINTEIPIALSSILCSIGPNGCYAPNVSAGLVIASPDRVDPDYFYTWTRDSALVIKGLVEIFDREYNETLQSHIQNYILSQAALQGVSNPSGVLEDGSGLGEPKYHVDKSAFTGNWGRPQGDGPALRAIAMAEYAHWLLQNGYNETAKDILWPIMRNDLDYVIQYWNQSSFDLWEETKGSSFFTVAAQYRALLEAQKLALLLGTSCESCAAVAPDVLCTLQNFWSPMGRYIVANFDDIDRTDRDANTILASIHHFDPSAGCDSITFQPCSDKSLANHKAVVDAFRFYKINHGIRQGEAVAVGRYPEDVYYGGNPWYLITLAAAEQLYDAIYVWKANGFIEVTQTSLGFFEDKLPAITIGVYHADSTEYSTLIEAISDYADGFVQIVAKYAHKNGSLAEQFDKNNGKPLSAYDLTWSYAALLTAAARRAGLVPRSWGAASRQKLPPICSGTAVVKSYSSVPPTTFPPSQTPISRTKTVSFTTSTATQTTSTRKSCSTATGIEVTFYSRVVTRFGETIKLAANIEELGHWDPVKAREMSARDYTDADPIWSTTVHLKAGETLQYKYIRIHRDNSVEWEGGLNHIWTVPSSCDSEISRDDVWQK